jgi:hypothetical protein
MKAHHAPPQHNAQENAGIIRRSGTMTMGLPKMYRNGITLLKRAKNSVMAESTMRPTAEDQRGKDFPLKINQADKMPAAIQKRNAMDSPSTGDACSAVLRADLPRDYGGAKANDEAHD